MGDRYDRVYGSSNADRMSGVIPNPNRRMNIGENVFLPDNVWDSSTGRVVQQYDSRWKKTSTSDTAFRFEQSMRNQAHKQGLRSKQLSLTMAAVLAMLFVVLLGAFTLSNRSTLLTVSDNLEQNRQEIKSLKKKIDDVQVEIDQAKSETTIGQQATGKLGMIHAEKALTISLVAMDAYPSESPNLGYTAEVAVSGWEEPVHETVQMSANME